MATAAYIKPKSEKHFHMSKAQLERLADRGDGNARFEINRRRKNKEAKRS